MRTRGDFHKDLDEDLKKPRFAAVFRREKSRLQLASRLRDAMEQANLSIRKVAQLMGTSKSQVERLVNNPGANVGIDTLIKFAAVMGRRLEIILR